MLSQQSRDSGLNQIRMAIQAHNNRRSAPPASIPIQPSQSAATVLKPSNVPKMGTGKMHKILEQFQHESQPMVPLQKTASGPAIIQKRDTVTMRFLNGSSGVANHTKQSSKITSKPASKPSSITSENQHTATNLNKSNGSLHKSRLADVKPRYLEPRKIVQPPEVHQNNKTGSNFSSRTASPSVVRRGKMNDSKASHESNISLDSLTSPNVKKGSVSSRNTSKESLASHDRLRINPKRSVPIANGTRIPTKPKHGSGSSSHSSSIATNHRLASVRSVSSTKSKSSDASPSSVTNHKSFFTQRSREILSKRAIEEKQKIENAINSATTARERNKLRAQLGIKPLAPVRTILAPKTMKKVDTTTREKNLKNIAKKQEADIIGAKDEPSPGADLSTVPIEEPVAYSRLERSSTFCKETSDNPDIVQID